MNEPLNLDDFPPLIRASVAGSLLRHCRMAAVDGRALADLFHKEGLVRRGQVLRTSADAWDRIGDWAQGIAAVADAEAEGLGIDPGKTEALGDGEVE